MKNGNGSTNGRSVHRERIDCGSRTSSLHVEGHSSTESSYRTADGVRQINEDGADKAELKECFATLLSLQFDLIEGIRAEHPELNEDELLKELGLENSES
jgi:hypothetical protein